MSVTLQITTALTTIDCGCCGGTYAINERYRQRCQEEGTSWHCPYCNASWGYTEGENARLKKQVAQLTSKVDQKEAALRAEREEHQQAIAGERSEHETTRHRLRGTKAALTRTKNAVAAGKCPCCAAEFADLATHMKDIHPGYHQADEQEEAAPA